MPPVQILPQDRPFDNSQIQNMNQSISNLVNTIESQRILNEEKSIASIISTINPISATGQKKTPVQINQEIKSKIDLSRQQKSRPSLFNIFSRNVNPIGISPTQQALDQSAITNLLDVEDKQIRLKDRAANRRLLEARATEAKAEATQRLSTSGATPSQMNLFSRNITSETEKLPVVSASESAASFIKNSGFTQEEQQRLREMEIAKFPAGPDRDDVIETFDIVDNGRDLGAMQDANVVLSNDLISNFAKFRNKTKGIKTTTELLNLVNDVERLDNFKYNLFKKMKFDKNLGTVSNHMLAIKENIRNRADDLDDTSDIKFSDLSRADTPNLNFIEENLFESFEFEDERAERRIINKSKSDTFEDDFIELQLLNIQKSNDLKDAEDSYEVILERLKTAEDVDAELEVMLKEARETIFTP